jgi:hypothetical protein
MQAGRAPRLVPVGALSRLTPVTGTHHRTGLTAHPGRAWAMWLLSEYGMP